MSDMNEGFGRTFPHQQKLAAHARATQDTLLNIAAEAEAKIREALASLGAAVEEAKGAGLSVRVGDTSQYGTGNWYEETARIAIDDAFVIIRNAAFFRLFYRFDL